MEKENKDGANNPSVKKIARDTGILMVAKKNPMAAIALHGVARIQDVQDEKKARKRKEKQIRRQNKKAAKKKGRGI